MLLLLCVWLTVRGVPPCVGEGGVLAVVLLGETSIQAPKDFFRSLKTPLLFLADLAVLLEDTTSLTNLVLLVCHQNGDCVWRVHLSPRPLHRHHRQLQELQCCHKTHSPH